ncbi:MAG: glutamate-5-semialdehyde dehydrogenase [Lentisphaerae bacterium RIFOXYB12_FULL_65_16]|nr:MAG: glutamate-5-semialdehyde dehydrogenase [Lentisphaerae bacterium RIFOXYA12_64_32]OGV90319.1 MAG: glutamate-5-semialdehyde dehydrogenase [Lentisphaerae bacterium RIFOXYB12_FULL_65_16]
MTVDYRGELMVMGRKAKQAARRLALMSTEKKNRCLEAIGSALVQRTQEILDANAQDLAEGQKANLSSAMLDRLRLTPARIEEMASGIRTLVGLPDPVGRVDSTHLRPNGLQIQKVRVPIGTIAIIYESRPNVTVDAGVLCLKAGNAVFLRGGKEAFHSNRILAEIMLTGGAAEGLPDGAVQIVPWTAREAVTHLVRLNECIDLVIPRGGESLIRAVTENATVPVIKHYKGVCHIYVDAEVDMNTALDIIENAKCQRPGVCNAVEKVLIHERVAAEFAPRLAARLGQRKVELRGDSRFCALVPSAKPASDQDWDEEYLDLILTVGVVDSLEQAVEHIALHGSSHSDAILTRDYLSAVRFAAVVDSAAVYVNASTRFTDGGQFGMGAEIGISTDRFHARGPMGLDDLTTYKYVVWGTGQVRP